ncbi:hypothetical protein BG006_001303 [Podila minutissima]|uniref:Septin-type G domain-containing protein n=1 Tax=Podila minutissima TaxID=64525 RepID=A0A9P5SDY9_9FUNG|nr:hypothetical protein BG006_001303 [Podila minutissima]
MSYSMRRKNLVSELNLMVVGNSGVGKTSFIRTLFGTLQLRASALKSLHKPDPSTSTTSSSKGTITPENRPTSPNSTTGNGIGTKANGTKDSVGYATGPLKRTLNSFEALFEIEECSEKINLTMVDTPGFVGTDEVVDTHCDEVIAYLEYQFDLTLAEERKVRRNPKATDNQIHACLYFIDHKGPEVGLSEADIRILKRLGTRVNLIPVIARADTLTRAQSKRLKQAILKDAVQNQIQFFQFLSPKLAKQLLNEAQEQPPKKGINHAEGEEEEEEDEEEEESEDEDDDLDPEVLEEKALLQSMTPFTVISQEEGIELKDEKGNRIQGREFPWGTLNCLDSKHCDMGGLRSALLLSHRTELKEITYGFFYEKYRTERLMARTKSQHIQHLKDQQAKTGSTQGTGLKNKESMLSITSGTPIAGPREE